MIFSSLEFLFFLPIVLLLFYWLPSKKLKLVFLICASLFYYGFWNPKYLALIIGSMVFNYILGSKIFARKSYTLLTFGVISNLVLLAYFKYTDFFIQNLNTILGLEWELQKIVLPLAISFFTFQQIAYLVDSYQNKVESNHPITYALFVCLFVSFLN